MEFIKLVFEHPIATFFIIGISGLVIVKIIQEIRITPKERITRQKAIEEEYRK